MIGINQTTHIPYTGNIIPANRTSLARTVGIFENNTILDNAIQNQTQTLLLESLNPAHADRVTNIFQQISALAFQAAEPGLTEADREVFQEQINQNSLQLTTFFEQLNQEDQTLFTAIFQNQPVLSPAATLEQASYTDPLLNQNTQTSEQAFLENFFSFDVISQAGLQDTFTRTGEVLKVLSLVNSESTLLEVLFDSITGYIYFQQLIDLEPSPSDEDTDETSSDTTDQENNSEDVGSTVQENISPPEPASPLLGPNSNPPTIIEFTS